MEIPLLLAIIIILSVGFAFLNGMSDSGTIVATVISSGALAPRKALMLASLAEFVGPFLFGVAVAATIGNNLFGAARIAPLAILAGLVAAMVWASASVRLGVPSSSTHALIGGLIGAVVVAEGFGAINLFALLFVLAALFLSPVLGFIIGYLLLRIVLVLTSRATPRVNLHFKQGQVLTSVALALTHGTLDAQKTMGVITLALVTFGLLPGFAVPLWVVFISAAGIAAGMAVGGWRTIRTLGMRIYRIRPVHGFAAQSAAAMVIFVSTLLGGPISSSQVISSSIIGVGASERASKVRWGVARTILVAWLITIPSSAIIAAGLYFLFSRLF